MGTKLPQYVRVQKGLQTASFKSTWLPDVNICAIWNTFFVAVFTIYDDLIPFTAIFCSKTFWPAFGCIQHPKAVEICDMIHRHAITCMKVWDPCKLWVSVGYPEREGTWHRNKNKLSCLVRLCHNKTVFATTRLVISLE